MQITLSWSECRLGAHVGIERHVMAMYKGLSDRHGCNPDRCWQVHIEGACGEIAVAKACGVYWDASVGTFKDSGDVGRWQVRTRSNGGQRDLIVRADDADDAKFILVVGQCPTYRIHGWISGLEAKQPEWLAGHGGREEAWFVPKEHLAPIESITNLGYSVK